MKKTLGIVAVAVGVVLCGGVGYSIASGFNEAADKINKALPEDEVMSPTSVPKAGQFTEGIWEVQKAGTYRVGAVLKPDTLCYWQISTDGAGEDIVKNGVETGGTPQVTLKKGQWFKTQGCGVWEIR